MKIVVKLTWENKSNLKENLNKIKFTNLNTFRVLNRNINQTNIDFTPNNWKNKLFWGDNLDVLSYLTNYLESEIDLIYIDPPFFSGANYKVIIEEDDILINKIAYSDDWDNNLDSYLQMLYERFQLIKVLLSSKGLLFVHLDWHASHYVKVILDEIFGKNRFINNIIWYYYNKYSAGKKSLPRSHDDILVYSKTSDYILNEIRIPREKPIKQLKRINVNGVLKNAKDNKGKVIYRIVKDKKMDDVWRIPCMQPASKEFTGYPTQKHHRLLKRIIELGSNEGDLIADFFCGSGTTLITAEKLKRRWIGSDNSDYAIYLTRNRLIDKFYTATNSSNGFELLSNQVEEKTKLIESGFFEKKLVLRRNR